MGAAPGETASEQEYERIKHLTALLNRASEAYYNHDTEIMSNLEYDKLYDELSALEEKTGIVLAGSPTVHVGYTAAEDLPKERHASPMLSLDKTKDRFALTDWLGGHEGLLSWKLDGLTVVLTYEGGTLQKAVTRGNGEIGEVITDNARVFKNLPLRIPCKEPIVLRGEAVIRYSDFNEINAELEAEAARTGDFSDVGYKNPRNLCSGSVRQLNNQITAKRRVRFYAFSLVQAGTLSFDNSRQRQMEFLREQGFETVEYVRVTPDNVADKVGEFEARIAQNDIPSDGLVLTLDDIAYGESLGTTAKFPRNSIAFKWADEIRETTLTEVEWSASRTGLINPVAIFEPVELEGTTVRRASVHNISIVKALKLGIGDRITVYKANMIIPQIAENLTGSGSLAIPVECPVCGQPTMIRQDNDTEVLVCPNPDCAAKKIKSFSLFVSRSAMNIDGLSEMTLEKLIAAGLIHTFADIYHLDAHRDVIEEMEGFGKKSCDRLLEAIEKSRETTLPRVLCAVGIPGIGISGARILCSHFGDDLAKIKEAEIEELSGVEGIGPVLAQNVYAYFRESGTAEPFDALIGELHIARAAVEDKPQILAGKTFVITGKVNHFANRDALKALIVSLGGKAAGSVSAKTDYLINNDVTSNSSKNKKARELGIAILSEEDFLAMIGERNG
ncbi:MAG: NAD-dependent DNA ligase LigA [Lachnospiraceae bacterium]|nr:NAD-dependent DNA ligase LigA [Lachnospiraceae bacterium]